MIYEVRTYHITPHKVPEVMKRFGEAYDARASISPLVGFFYTDIGPLNQIIHIWPYENIAERERIRVEAAKLPNWPPNISEFLEDMNSEIFIPFPFTPEFKPGNFGPVFEWRSYTIKPHSVGGIQERWGEALEEREKLSPVLMGMTTELGPLNKFVHIWPYESLNHRAEIRAEAAAKGIWPPKGGGDELLRQDNKILFAAPFSPIQ